MRLFLPLNLLGGKSGGRFSGNSLACRSDPIFEIFAKVRFLTKVGPVIGLAGGKGFESQSGNVGRVKSNGIDVIGLVIVDDVTVVAAVVVIDLNGRTGGADGTVVNTRFAYVVATEDTVEVKGSTVIVVGFCFEVAPKLADVVDVVAAMVISDLVATETSGAKVVATEETGSEVVATEEVGRGSATKVNPAIWSSVLFSVFFFFSSS